MEVIQKQRAIVEDKIQGTQKSENLKPLTSWVMQQITLSEFHFFICKMEITYLLLATLWLTQESNINHKNVL